jgi:(4S)-4-hydroxy-5-phosphonooxypentane-2,3-dione isomerase
VPGAQIDRLFIKKLNIMIVTCVYINVKPEAVDQFIKVTTENHLASVREPGNLRFDILQKADDPCQFILYEAYESDEASASHKTTAHYLKWRDSVSSMMAEQRQGVKYNIIQPSDRTQW